MSIMYALNIFLIPLNLPIFSKKFLLSFSVIYVPLWVKIYFFTSILPIISKVYRTWWLQFSFSDGGNENYYINYIQNWLVMMLVKSKYIPFLFEAFRKEINLHLLNCQMLILTEDISMYIFKLFCKYWYRLNKIIFYRTLRPVCQVNLSIYTYKDVKKISVVMYIDKKP